MSRAVMPARDGSVKAKASDGQEATCDQPESSGLKSRACRRKACARAPRV